ncbi:MAG: ArsR/SmtB family transcription factor [Rhizobiaceae bacterium]
MNDGPSIATVGALIGDHARASILCTLLDGQTRTATELSHRAGVSASTASAHLTKLVDGRLLAVEKQGRHRFYRLASAEIGQMLETMLAVSDASIPTNKIERRNQELRAGRMCYDHIAGRLGVALTDSLIERNSVTITGKTIELTDSGKLFFRRLGIDVEAVRKRRRKFADYCIDWSERRPHLSGALGEALATHCVKNKWIYRLPDTRAVRITPKGRQEMKIAFSLSLD